MSNTGANVDQDQLREAHDELVNIMRGKEFNETTAWCAEDNRYFPEGTDSLENNLKNEVAAVDEAKEYIASSIFVHSSDAWSYLGRAVDSLLKGDVNAAVHLTYYSELRAAKSILASEGIFIGRGRSYICTKDDGFLEVSNNSTHIAAWKILDAWFEGQRAVEKVSEMVLPDSSPLHVWLDRIPAGKSVAVSEMLRDVALDFESFKLDKGRRNVASYEPSSLLHTSLDPDLIKQIVADLWVQVEPHTNGGFPRLDQAILATVLKRQYLATEPSEAGQTTRVNAIDSEDWKNWINSLTPAGKEDTALQQALLEGPGSEDFEELVGVAFNDTREEINPSKFIRPMMSRATILARFATGLGREILVDAGLSSNVLRSWLDDFAVARGLIEHKPLPESSLDLYDDMRDALESLEKSGAANLKGLYTDLEIFIGALGQTERIVTWSYS
mgnify:CR=1 FL=1